MRILHGLKPLHDGRFSKWSHFSNIYGFLSGFLHRTPKSELYNVF